jgi:hypothetical protein
MSPVATTARLNAERGWVCRWCGLRSQPMVDLFDRVLREIRERKEQARAAVEESRRLEAALAALDAGRVEGSRASRPTRRQPAACAPRGANRAAVLTVVGERPGVSAGQVTSATGIARPIATSTLAKLVADGGLERVELPGRTRGYRLAQKPTAESRTDGEGGDAGDVDGELVDDENVAEQPA